MELHRARPLLGTMVDIRVAGPHSAADLHAAIDSAFDAIGRIQRLMSFQDPDSELSRINQAAINGEQPVDPETFAVLEAALAFALLSQGAFDPCVGTQLVNWGYLPGRQMASATPRLGTWRDIELTYPCRVRFHRPVCVDLGGIAKGYAVDRAIAVLQAAGIENLVVNAGGDLRVSGRWSQDVRLRHPQAPQHSAHALKLCNSALATSASYYSRRRQSCGSEVSALVDPGSGTPHLADDSVSVQAGDCMSADALTKIVLFAPPHVAERALATANAWAIVQPEAEIAA